MTNRNKTVTNNNKFNRRKEINKMKTSIFTIVIMVAALAMFAPAAEADDFKVTGGGWIIADEDSRPTFGFQMKCKGNKYDPDATVCIGNLQYNDRVQDIKIHSIEVKFGSFSDEDNLWKFKGRCRIQSDSYVYKYVDFVLMVNDEVFGIAIMPQNGKISDSFYFSNTNYDGDLLPVPLGGGNINIKEK